MLIATWNKTRKYGISTFYPEYGKCVTCDNIKLMLAVMIITKWLVGVTCAQNQTYLTVSLTLDATLHQKPEGIKIRSCFKAFSDSLLKIMRTAKNRLLACIHLCKVAV